MGFVKNILKQATDAGLRELENKVDNLIDKVLSPSEKAQRVQASWRFQQPSSTPSVSRELVKKDYEVAGVEYYLDNIGKLACINKNYRYGPKRLIESGLIQQKIFQYTYVNKPVKLIPEPSNRHDRNAIMVLIAGEKVGYISMDKNMEVHHILAHGDIKYISSFISGGNFKVVSLNEDVIKSKQFISINVRIAYAI